MPEGRGRRGVWRLAMLRARPHANGSRGVGYGRVRLWREGQLEDLVKRRKLDFVIAGKLILWVDVRGGRVAFRRRTFRSQADLQVLLPNFVAEGGDGFGADAGNGLEQKLGDLAEGDSVLARDVIFRQKAKDLAEGAVHFGGGSEVGGESFVARGPRRIRARGVGSSCVLASGVEKAEIGVMVGAAACGVRACRKRESGSAAVRAPV